MKIRKATLKDFEKIKQLRTEFYLLETTTDKYQNPEWVKHGLPVATSKALRSKKAAYFVAENDGKLIGFSASEIEKNPKWMLSKKQGHLYNLYVIPQYQRKGIGTKLLEKSLEWFKKNKIKELKILAYSWNTQAQKLYRKYGFSDYILTMKK